jgi:murein DD-endopeptidase MepM/ murein hydrolase activator NlpD
MLASALAAAIAIAGCGSGGSVAPGNPAVAQRPLKHTVVAGETLYKIGNRYRVAYQAATLGTAFSGVRPYSGERAARHFLWPVAQGVVSSGFGIRNGAMHDGVDIAAPAGTPVYAADTGVVIFSGTLHGYGNTVIIRHDASYTTVYGHNQRNLVRDGDRVASGQEIGVIGRTGRTTGANLHFEVRCDNAARDPLAYLPQPAPESRISFAAAGGG